MHLSHDAVKIYFAEICTIVRRSINVIIAFIITIINIVYNVWHCVFSRVGQRI